MPVIFLWFSFLPFVICKQTGACWVVHRLITRKHPSILKQIQYNPVLKHFSSLGYCWPSVWSVGANWSVGRGQGKQGWRTWIVSADFLLRPFCIFPTTCEWQLRLQGNNPDRHHFPKRPHKHGGFFGTHASLRVYQVNYLTLSLQSIVLEGVKKGKVHLKLTWLDLSPIPADFEAVSAVLPHSLSILLTFLYDHIHRNNQTVNSSIPTRKSIVAH